jgi:hypothetical protein
MRKVILFCLIFQIVSCQNKKINPTPTKFLSIVNVSKEIYTKDSLNLIQRVKNEMISHNGGYSADFYNHDTPIIIDTIMYSPRFDKIVFFAIDSIENKKTYPDNLSAEEINEVQKIVSTPYQGYHYNASVFIGKRDEKVFFKVYDFSKRYLGKYKNIQELRKRLRKKFFVEYSTIKEKGFEYNIDDRRFWDNPNIWNSIEKEAAKWQEFEKLKKEHPENVYEPAAHKVP